MSKKDQTVLEAYANGADPIQAYITGYPIAKRWKEETVLSKFKALLKRHDGNHINMKELREQVKQKKENIALSNKEFDKFVDTCENAPKPNKKLKEAKQEQKNHTPRYTISENGVGYMPSEEIAKTNEFKKQKEATKQLQAKRKTQPRKNSKSDQIPQIFQFNEKQRAAYEACTHLQRGVVLNMVKGGMIQREAYYAAGGTAKDDNSADAAVSTMLSNIKCKAFYDSLMEERASTAIMTREEALERLTKIARTNMKDVIQFKQQRVGETDDGDPIYQLVVDGKDSAEITDDQAIGICEVSTGKTGLKIKTHSQAAAIKQLSVMEGWESAKKYEFTGKDGGPIETKITPDMSQDEAARIYKESLKKKEE